MSKARGPIHSGKGFTSIPEWHSFQRKPKLCTLGSGTASAETQAIEHACMMKAVHPAAPPATHGYHRAKAGDAQDITALQDKFTRDRAPLVAVVKVLEQFCEGLRASRLLYCSAAHVPVRRPALQEANVLDPELAVELRMQRPHPRRVGAAERAAAALLRHSRRPPG